MKPNASRFLYVFIDEAGNLDFSRTGTEYFLIGCITKERPFFAYQELSRLKYDLVEKKVDTESFHASEDQQSTRNEVFGVIRRNLDKVHFDSVVVEKRKTGPALQEPVKFYPRMLGYLLKHVLKQRNLGLYEEVIVFTDQLPVKKRRSAIEKAVKTTLSAMLPNKVRYRIYHHDSKSNFNLQVADYFNWAVFRKWTRGDTRSYDLVKQAIKSEFDIFRTGSTYYY